MLGTGRKRLKKRTEKKQMLQSIQKQKQGEIKKPRSQTKSPQAYTQMISAVIT